MLRPWYLPVVGGTLSISFSSVVSSLAYTSSVGLQERSSLEGESLRRIASTRRGWRCPCFGVRTDDWNWEQIRTFPSHTLAVFVKIRFSAGLWQRIAMPYGAVEFSRVVVVLVYSLPMWRTGAYNFNVSTRLHESQRHRASNGLLLLYRSSHSCRLGFGPNSELGCAIGRPSFEIPRSFMYQGPQGRSLPLTEKAR